MIGAAQSVDGGRELALAALLDAHPDLDGLLTYNDIIAIGAAPQGQAARAPACRRTAR